ncbi:MAG: hypothetical protein UV24_C0019G0007 [Candidatus Nomurabacteria bacterium GW2011_GWA2_42_41]|nr:MAG: hypothetical protein UV24_C0019G0007 [Candidatus Nomurabacteria bacterium GW2011_GWA2_42_41]
MKSNKIIILFGAASMVMIITVAISASLFFSMKNKTEESIKFSEKINELSGKESHTASASSALRRESINIEKISKFFFKENEISVFIKKVEALGPQSGTRITIESLEKGFTEKTVPLLNFRIKAIGTFSEVSRLLVLLENFPGEIGWNTLRVVREDLEAGAVSRGGAPIWRAEAYLTILNFVNE